MTARSKLQQAKNKKWEDLLEFHLQTNGLRGYFVREYIFIPGRQFRLDFADPINKIGLEVQGAIWSKGKSAHNSGTGINRDAEKINLGHMHDWRLFQFTSDTIRSLQAVDMIRRYYIQKLKIELPPAGRAN